MVRVLHGVPNLLGAKVGKKSPNERIERIELICMGAGFLLKKLRHTYGSDFGCGMTEQVNQCIRDIEQVERGYMHRQDVKAQRVESCQA